MNSFNREPELKDTESAVKNKLIDLLTKFKCFKFVTTLTLQFKKIQSDDKTLQSTFYSNPKAEIIINESDIDDAFKSIYSTVIPGLTWIIDSIIDHTLNISKYNLLVGISC